jgi:hypothetical protein
LLGLPGKKDDLPAVRTLGQMRKALQALVFGQHAFEEGVELVRFEVLAGLEKIVHVCFLPEGFVLSLSV